MDSTKFGLCVNPNVAFLDEKCIWIITLSDGTIVYQDDSNPSLKKHMHHSAWVRLKKYLQKTKLKIVSWKLKFRDQEVDLGCGKGYFYSRSAIAIMSGGSNNTEHFHIVGVAISKSVTHINRFWYHAPSLVCTQGKEVEISKLNEDGVIWI